jgi:hypothetical protein
MPARKKTEEPAENSGPTAKKQHRIVTTYTEEVPIDTLDQPEQEPDGEPEEYQEAEQPVFLPSQFFIEPEEDPDPIAAMMRDLQVAKRSHSWTVVIERLPNYERDSRWDVGARRVNCGTRSVTPDFLEEIRREFARPGRPNHFRLTIKRDGKIHANWPEVVSLEPPPLEDILAEDAKLQAVAPPSLPFSDPHRNFKQLIEQMKQLAELRSVLFPDAPAPLANPAAGLMTEEAALLKLLSADGSVVEQITRRLSRRLFAEGPAEESPWAAVLTAALNNAPIILDRLGFRPGGLAGPPAAVEGPQAVPAREPLASPAPPAGPPLVQAANPEPGPSPELFLLSRVLQYCADQVPAAGAAAWVDSFASQNPGVAPMVDLFVSMSPGDCLSFLKTYFPNAAPIVEAAHAPGWITALQAALTEQQEEPA